MVVPLMFNNSVMARAFLTHIKWPEQWAQVLNVVGEAGELAEAYRRYSGNARRSGSRADVLNELADVIISAYCLAIMMGEDANELCENKWSIIMTRGFGNQEL